jgi:hypothetical protein
MKALLQPDDKRASEFRPPIAVFLLVAVSYDLPPHPDQQS